mmetsp:Transcript_12031/g.36182  ORF Transcript_12031/g.36182 Transcript_12031/m.36182 type:complete len:1189 (-) Transcript_12031:25-3591(-)
MASVQGLLEVKTLRCRGVRDAAAGATITARLRLLPWKEEIATKAAAAADEDGGASWTDAADESDGGNCVTLAHLAAHDEAPRLRVTLKGRELYVYERTLGEGTIDAAPFLIARDEPKEAWVPLEPAGEVLLELRFRTGVTTAAPLLRTASTPALDGPEQPRHQHLFRLASWGRPTWCAVCEGLMVGLRHQGFQCETCGLACHDHCQLRAHAVHDCVGRGAASPETVPAEQPAASPRKNSDAPRRKASDAPSRRPSNADDGSLPRTGVGRLTLHLDAVRLDDDLRDKDEDDDDETQPERAAGDYYVRVAVAPSRDAARPARGHAVRRTHTVYQTKEPRFDVRWQFAVPSFASEVRCELVDAAREAVVGAARFGVLDLLQEAADFKAARWASDARTAARGLFPPGAAPAWTGRRPTHAPARPDYFADPRNSALRDGLGRRRATASWVESTFDVFSQDLWWALEPRAAPVAEPPSQFSVEITRTHIQRATDAVYAFYAFMDAYDAFMRWTEPLKTGFAFAMFIGTCVFLDAEYAGLVPVLALALLLARLAERRFLGDYPRGAYLDEAFERADAEQLGGKDARYRPVGYVRAAVCAGRSLGAGAPKDAAPDLYAVATLRRPLKRDARPRSPSVLLDDARAEKDDWAPPAVDESLEDLLGAPGEAPPPLDGTTPRRARQGEVESLAWFEESALPMSPAHSSDDRDETPPEQPASLFDERVLGYTGTSRQTSEPRWHGPLGAALDKPGGGASNLVKRFAARVAGRDDGASLAVVEPWPRRGWRGGRVESSSSSKVLVDRALVCPVLRPIDENGALQEWSEHAAELRVTVMREHPLDRLLDAEVGSAIVPVADLVDAIAKGPQRERRGWHALLAPGSEDATPSSKTEEPPAVHLRLQLTLRDSTAKPAAQERAASRAVEAMVGDESFDNPSLQQNFTKVARDATRPLSTAVTAHEYVFYAQNVLGRYLDFLESLKNLFTWAHPEKTGAFFLAACVGVLLFARIRTRWLVLAAGTYEFLYRLLPGEGSPMTTRVFNAIRATPSDRALRCCYAARGAARAALLVAAERTRRRRARLHAIWASAWEGPCELRSSADGPWQRRRVVVHGRRMRAWASEREIDAGRAPRDQLVLLGHAGLTAPSPTDARGLAPERAGRVLVVFGQTPDGAPARWVLVCAEDADRERLRGAIGEACAEKLE